MSILSVEGYTILVKNVNKKELKDYEEWLETKSYSGNMGYNKYPSKIDNCITLMIESGFNGTWWREILPDLKDYWSEERIIHEVEFEEDVNEL